MNTAQRTVCIAHTNPRETGIQSPQAIRMAMADESSWEMQPVLLAITVPVVRSRRVLEQMLAAEPAGAAAK